MEIRKREFDTEAYRQKMDELRKERDYHNNEAHRLQMEMDCLEGDRNIIEVVLGKYILFDCTSKGGYKYYKKVERYESRTRGVTVYGPGWHNSRLFLTKGDTLTILWDDMDLVKEITEEEYDAAFNEYVEEIRRGLHGE